MYIQAYDILFFQAVASRNNDRTVAGKSFAWCLLGMMPSISKAATVSQAAVRIGGQTEGRDCIILALTLWCSKSMTCLDEMYTFGLG
jgi:hypothetical protein